MPFNPFPTLGVAGEWRVWRPRTRACKSYELVAVCNTLSEAELIASAVPAYLVRSGWAPPRGRR